MSKHIGIIGVVIAFLGFAIYYPYAFAHYSEATKSFDDTFIKELGVLSYIPITFALCLLSWQLSIKAGNKHEFRVYGFNAVLWAGISFAFVLKDVLHIITTKLFIITALSACLAIGLFLYFYRLVRNQMGS